METLLGKEVGKLGRHMRYPTHDFYIKQRPFVIQPFCIAPVLPGETLKAAMLQVRCVTSPIKNPHIGWWMEHYLFYVKINDLYDRDKLVEMFLDPAEDMSALDSPTKLDYYHENGSSGSDIDWTTLCMETIVNNYFRFEGETFADGTLTGLGGATNLPIAAVKKDLYIDSLINDAAFVTNTQQELLDISAGTTLEGSDDKLMTDEVYKALERYKMMTMAGLTDLTIEEYWAQYYGGSAPKPARDMPELIRKSVEWTYPTNTINPSTGAPTSAASWAVKVPIDKKRFFKEPGFLVGVTVVRPKVYMKNLSSSAVMSMKSTKSWLPPSLMMDPYASMAKHAAGDPPVTNSTDAYWFDIKDLLLHGDEFKNFALTATDSNLADLPTAAGLMRYIDSTSLDAMFVAASPANGYAQDGQIAFSIAGRQVESSPSVIGTNVTV